MEQLRALFNKTLRVLLVFAIATPEGLMASTEIEPGSQLEVVAQSGLNVRKKPGARKIGAIPNGSAIFSAGEPKDGWIPVLYENEAREWITGYVSQQYTQVKNSDSNAAAVSTINQPANNLTEQPPQVSLKLTVNVQTRARLRMSPSLSGKIADRLTNDTEVEIIGKPKGAWIPVKITSTGKLGWIHSTLLEADSATYGERNPLEVASGHSTDAVRAGATVLANYHNADTEGGILEYCESCENNPSQISSDANAILNSFAPQSDYVFPIRANYRFTSGFGRRWGRNHNGADFAVPIGTSIYATRAGTVTAATTQRGYGRIVTIRHDNNTTSSYAHLNEALVRVGDQVSTGQLIAKSGNTGRSTGPHLHFEIKRNGVPVDPMTYFQ